MKLENVERLAFVVVSAFLWVGFGLIGQLIFDWAHHSAGIDLVYLPAGVRLVIVLTFKVWGALGIAVANPVMALYEFGQQDLTELLVNAFIAGFVPFLTVVACCRIAGVDPNLAALKPRHIPVFALAVSVVTPLMFNLQFLIFSVKPNQDFAANLSAMILGDFLGCLIALGIARIGISLYRQAMSLSNS